MEQPVADFAHVPALPEALGILGVGPGQRICLADPRPAKPQRARYS